MRFLIMTLALGWTTLGWAAIPAASDHAEHAIHATTDHAPTSTAPHLSHDSTWAGVMMIVIAAIFIAAAAIGPIVRANMPEELPPSHSHDEPPGDSHHHGSSGTAHH